MTAAVRGHSAAVVDPRDRHDPISDIMTTLPPRMADDQHRYPHPAIVSLRPAIEDQWGAGGLIDLRCEGGWQGVAPEAHAAAAAYRAVADDVPTALGHCASGRELIDIGFADDVRTAAQLDSGGRSHS